MAWGVVRPCGQPDKGNKNTDPSHAFKRLFAIATFFQRQLRGQSGSVQHFFALCGGGLVVLCCGFVLAR